MKKQTLKVLLAVLTTISLTLVGCGENDTIADANVGTEVDAGGTEMSNRDDGNGTGDTSTNSGTTGVTGSTGSDMAESVAGTATTEGTTSETDKVEAPVHEHSYTAAVTKEATCSEVGVKTYTCSCGETYAEDIEKLAHTEGDWVIVTEVSFDANGLQQKMCTVCGEALVSEEIYPEIVASGAFEGTNIEWKIIGTTLYVVGDGPIPNFQESGSWFNRWGADFPHMAPMAWEMYYDYVEDIVLSEGITAIGDFNFCGFSKVTGFNFPSTLTKIGKHGMNGMGLTNLEIPRHITSLSAGAFQNLKKLTYLFIPSNIEKIPGYCFCGGYALTRIDIEEGVKEIGESAFGMAPIYDAGVLLAGSNGFEVHVPESVTFIGDYAFATGATYGPITVYGKAGSYVDQWIQTENCQPEVSFVAE